MIQLRIRLTHEYREMRGHNHRRMTGAYLLNTPRAYILYFLLCANSLVGLWAYECQCLCMSVGILIVSYIGPFIYSLSSHRLRS
ncbi:hypothetical protein C8R42DRAFT_381445 [Lentinula raphanica]|nr:hypothetical protein C8R42DRAFT_381445 [Lentinula raphanica]